MRTGKTKRAQILMAPQEYEQLQKIARSRRLSVAELIRQAVQERYLSSDQHRTVLLEQMFAMNIPVDDWSNLDAEVTTAHDSTFVDGSN